MNDPVSGRLDPLLLFLHGFLTAEHTQGELIDSGLHHGPKLPLHKPVLPGRPLQIVEADHGLLALPLEAHRVAVLLHVLAARVVLLYGVLPLEHVIPVSLLLLAAGERIGFVFHACGRRGGDHGGQINKKKRSVSCFGRAARLKKSRELSSLLAVFSVPSASSSSSSLLLSLLSYVLQSVRAPLPPARLLQTETERPDSPVDQVSWVTAIYRRPSAPAAQKRPLSRFARHCGLTGTCPCTLFT